MKLSLTSRFATISLLLVAAAATLEASSLYDAAILERRSVSAQFRDLAHPRKHHHSADVRPSVKLAQSPSQNLPSHHLAHAYGGSETIKPANTGKCHSVGATGTTRTMYSLVAWRI